MSDVPAFVLPMDVGTAINRRASAGARLVDLRDRPKPKTGTRDADARTRDIGRARMEFECAKVDEHVVYMNAGREHESPWKNDAHVIARFAWLDWTAEDVAAELRFGD